MGPAERSGASPRGTRGGFERLSKCEVVQKLPSCLLRTPCPPQRPRGRGGAGRQRQRRQLRHQQRVRPPVGAERGLTGQPRLQDVCTLVQPGRTSPRGGTGGAAGDGGAELVVLLLCNGVGEGALGIWGCIRRLASWPAARCLIQCLPAGGLCGRPFAGPFACCADLRLHL